VTRQTVRVVDIVARANLQLAQPDCARGGVYMSADVRRGIIAALEPVLHQADAYAGFRYLRSELNDDGTLRPQYDDTRREYILHRKLTATS
jgi:hypothetical protein